MILPRYYNNMMTQKMFLNVLFGLLKNLCITFILFCLRVTFLHSLISRKADIYPAQFE